MFSSTVFMTVWLTGMTIQGATVHISKERYEMESYAQCVAQAQIEYRMAREESINKLKDSGVPIITGYKARVYCFDGSGMKFNLIEDLNSGTPT